METTTRLSQLSCFTSIHRKYQLQRRFISCPTIRPKSFVVMSLDGNGSDTTSPVSKTTISYEAEVSKPYIEEAKDLHQTVESHVTSERETDLPVEEGAAQHKGAAKIHDFCFGIPYGGLILSGGVLGSIFSRNLSTLTNGVLFGGALLALSTFSLKIWREGKSSVPFILGQAALSAVLLWKNFQAYSLTKKLIPTGFYAAISTAMLCFYTYVVISGGNPPPKKSKSSAAAPS